MKRPGNIIFVTGTDTAIGKTVMTGMLLHYLRQQGVHALAMKPFCSGSLLDVEILRQLQNDELSVAEINPYYFPDPVAPIASRNRNAKISAADVAEKIRAVAGRCELLLVEGCGGLKVPISKDLFLIDVITELGCPVILVGPNKLGVLNHTLLSVEALRVRGLKDLVVVLMGQAEPDISVKTNAKVLANELGSVPVITLRYLGRALDEVEELKKASRVVRKMVAHADVRTHRFASAGKRGRKEK